MGNPVTRSTQTCWLCSGRGTIDMRDDDKRDEFDWTVRQQTNGIQLVMLGDLTERTHFGDFAQGATLLGIDFRGVRHINTAGTLTLTRFLESLGDQRIEAIGCSPAIVRQLSLLPMLLDRMHVVSVMVPFECVGCECERQVELDVDHHAIDDAPSLTCETCLGPMKIEQELAEYLAFLPAQATR